MPYELKDPNATTMIDAGVPGTTPGTPEEAEILDVQEAPALSQEIGELRSSVLSAQSAEEARAQEAVESSREYDIIRAAGQGLRTVQQEFDAAVLTIQRNANLSAEGRDEGRARAGAARNEGFDRIADAVLSTAGDALLARFPEQGFASSPSVEVIAEASLIYTSFGAKAARTFLSEAIGALRRAIDPVTPVNDRVRGNMLLHAAYGPLIERRAIAPERFARGLQGAYGELAELIRVHLDTVFKAARHRAAVDFVARSRRDFTYLVNSTRQAGRWDDTFELGTPSFDWT